MRMARGKDAVPKLARIAPELPVFDLPRSVAYYANKLGFRVVMEMPDRRYAVVERDDVRKPWGNRDFRVLDDSGNEIKFTEPLSGGE